MKIELTKSSQSGSVLVAFAVNSKRGKTDSLKLTHSGLEARLKSAIESKELSSKAQESVLFRDIEVDGFRHAVVVGLGEIMDHEAFRQAAAVVHGHLKALKANDVSVAMDAVLTDKRKAAKLVQGFTEGLLLTDYNFDELKTKKKDTTEKKMDMIVRLVCKLATDAAVKKAHQEGVILAESVNFSRRLGDMPGNLMTPTILANTVVDAVKGTGIKATIWDGARISKEKMGGLYGVSQGSDQDPRFIILEYKGAAASKKPVAFVGKGLTFDCGGISIKPSAAMEEMKYDMCGGANVIGAAIAIAKLKLKINLICLVPATENLVNGSATKPGDVHFARNGKSFEINNTDAEGRLILADALCYATEQEPQVIIDAATLTGAMVIALGNIHTGYFTRNAALKKKIEAAAAASGEWVWNMPLTDHHVKDMKGTYADLSNISSGKGAGSATAAGFLEQFVGEGIPWAHFDIAGTGWGAGNRLPYAPKKGASGAMIRTFVELAKMY
ncbi:MAG: leucyl aminopeptidase [Pseudobdellovibrionaceae bacterium]